MGNTYLHKRKKLMPDNIKQKIIKIVAETFKTEGSAIDPDVNLETLEHYDSLEKLNLFLKIEKDLDVKLTLDDMLKITTTADLITIIRSKNKVKIK